MLEKFRRDPEAHPLKDAKRKDRNLLRDRGEL